MIFSCSVHAAVKADPKNVHGWQLRGSAYAEKGEKDKAFGDFKEAIVLDPNNAATYLYRAHLYLVEAEPESAQRLKLYVYRATPSSGVTWVDDFMLVTHYLGGFANVTSPAFLVQPVKLKSEERNLFAVYADNVRIIEGQSSTEITGQNVANYD